MLRLSEKFRQIDGPTWLVAIALYGAWFALIWYSARPAVVGDHARGGLSARVAFLAAA